ncbi:MAG: hypothetical protein H6872_06430 [Methylobacteriaceae bacterium]|nr:hypothetical protein [Rhodoblastus sp.]MCC0004783.1 hypothetical protein [Methylobacteriaceae bacterium]
MRAKGSATTTRLRRAGVFAGAFGWAALIALAVSRLTLGAPRDDGALAVALVIAVALLMTGATLLILDALRAGFGALDSFFAAALARSAQRRDEPARPPPPARSRRGVIGDRPFIEHDDGSVIVDTLLGPRLFPSLADAQDFVGS